MTAASFAIRDLRRALAAGASRPSELAELALSRANLNAGRNTYLWQDRAWTRAEAARAEAMPRGEIANGGGPFRRWPPRALGPAHLGKGLL